MYEIDCFPHSWAAGTLHGCIIETARGSILDLCLRRPPPKPSASVPTDCKETQRTSVLKLVVELIRIAHLTKNVTEHNPSPKQESVNDYV